MVAEKKHGVPMLRFPEFDGEWDSKILNDITKINQGLQIPISERYKTKGKGRFFYITNEFLKPNSKITYYIENPPKSVICGKDDILMTRTGNTGQVVTNVEGAFHNNFFKIKYSKECFKSFLFYFLKNTKTQNSILRLAGTSTIPDLNHGDFYKIKIDLPIISEQKKIASFLSAIDDKIQQLSKKKALLEQYKKGLMQQIFSQKLRFKREDGGAYPAWEEKRLGEIGKTLNGLTGKTKNDFGRGKPYIQYKQIFDNSKILTSDCGNVIINENENQSKVKFGDIFFTTSSETPLEVGYSSVLLESVEEMYLNSFCFGFRPNSFELINPLFASFLFRSETVRKEIIKLAQGSTRFNMSKLQFLKIIINLPTIDEQKKIASFLTSIDTKIEQIGTQLGRTQIFKKGLLQQMFV